MKNLIELENEYYIVYNKIYVGKAIFCAISADNVTYWGTIRNHKLLYFNNNKCEIYFNYTNIPPVAFDSEFSPPLDTEPVVLNE